MTLGGTQQDSTWTRPAPAWVLVAAGLASVGITVIGPAALGPAGLLIGWLASAVACGLVLAAAHDPRATRAAVAMIVLLPATVSVSGLLILPLLAPTGPWVTGPLSIVVIGLTPSAAIALAGRRPAPPDLPVGAPWLWARLGLAACTGAVVVSGHTSSQLAGKHGQLDDGFFALLLLGLLPVLVYVIGTRRPTTVLACGSVILVVTAAAWVLLLAEDGNQFAGVWVSLGWMVALVVAAAGALRDS